MSQKGQVSVGKVTSPQGMSLSSHWHGRPIWPLSLLQGMASVPHGGGCFSLPCHRLTWSLTLRLLPHSMLSSHIQDSQISSQFPSGAESLAVGPFSFPRGVILQRVHLCVLVQGAEELSSAVLAAAFWGKAWRGGDPSGPGKGSPAAVPAAVGV